MSDSDSIQDDMTQTHATESDSDSMHNTEMSDIESMQDSDVDSNMHNNNCQRSRVHCQPNKHKETEKENLVPSQITIMQSNDTPFSSDESVLDVAVDYNVRDKIFNPWGDMNVNDIPLDITDTDTDSSTTSELMVVKTDQTPEVIFSPLSNIEHLNSTRNFHIKLKPSKHTIHLRGIGLVFKTQVCCYYSS